MPNTFARGAVSKRWYRLNRPDVYAAVRAAEREAREAAQTLVPAASAARAA